MFNEVVMQENEYTEEQVEKLVEVFEELCEKLGDYVGDKAGSDEKCFIVYNDVPYENELGMGLDEFNELAMKFDWWGFSDEYSYCEHCCGIVKLNDPNDCIRCEHCVLCVGCAEECAEDIVESEYINNPNRALMNFKDKLKEMNFVKEGSYESGWYGVNDNPKSILKRLKKDDNEVIFVIDRIGQFVTEYSAYTRSV